MKRLKELVVWLLVIAMTIFATSIPQVNAIPIGGDPGDLPGIDCLLDTSLNFFTASPSTINAGGSSLLSWSASVPSGCSVAIKLNGQTVNKVGSMSVQPAFDKTYTLRAYFLGGSRVLGSRTVTVQGVECDTIPVPAAMIISGIENVVDGFTASNSEVYEDSSPQIALSSLGIDLGLFLKININNFFDPNLDIDARIRLQIINNNIVASYSFFDADFSWPWYVNVLLWPTLIAEFVVEELIEDDLAEAMLEEVQAYVDGQVALAEALIRAENGLSANDPLNINFTNVSTSTSGVNVSACFSF